MAVDPYADPQFLAFQRAMGVSEAELAASTAQRKEQLGIGLQSRMPDYTRQEEQGQQQIADDFESRGVFGSGVRVQRQNESAGDVQRKVYQDMLGVQGDQGQLDLELAKQIAANRRSSADNYLSSSSNQATGNAKGILDPIISGA